MGLVALSRGDSLFSVWSLPGEDSEKVEAKTPPPPGPFWPPQLSNPWTEKGASVVARDGSQLLEETQVAVMQ